MKKFWTILALLAVALNFSVASLWALEVQEQSASVETVLAADKKDGTDEETAAATDEEKAEEATPVVVKSATDVAVLDEEKTEEMGSVLPDTTQTEDKIS